MLRRDTHAYVRPDSSGDCGHARRVGLPTGGFSALRRRRRDQSGAAVVEFALILIPFFTLIFGLIQYGLYFYSAQTGSHAINSAARELSVGNCQDTTQLKTYLVKELGSAAKSSTVTVTVAYKNIDGSTPAAPQAQNVTVGGQVTVTVRFQSINMHFPLVPFLNDAHVVRTARARVEDKTAEVCNL